MFKPLALAVPAQPLFSATKSQRPEKDVPSRRSVSYAFGREPNVAMDAPNVANALVNVSLAIAIPRSPPGTSDAPRSTGSSFGLRWPHGAEVRRPRLRMFHLHVSEPFQKHAGI